MFSKKSKLKIIQDLGGFTRDYSDGMRRRETIPQEAVVIGRNKCRAYYRIMLAVDTKTKEQKLLQVPLKATFVKVLNRGQRVPHYGVNLTGVPELGSTIRA